jgi:hypothetical protein
MPIPPPQSLDWPADRALLLVHGIGNARPGDYDSLVAQLTGILDGQPNKYAIYTFYYDQVNEWFSTKVQAAQQIATFVSAIRARLEATKLGNSVADFAGDIIWPVLIADAREAVRTAFLAQLQQIIRDGRRAKVTTPFQRLSIICHSLGCFHTFEALHAAARSTTQGLAPGTDGVRFENVIFMASPVQLIRTVGRDIGAVIPQPGSLTCVSAQTLAMPSETIITGEAVTSSKHTVSITGNLDPVGGYFFRNPLTWAYMHLPDQESRIDRQDFVNMQQSDLEKVLTQALQDHGPPQITVQSPHDWGKYVDRHATDLQGWLNVPRAT